MNYLNLNLAYKCPVICFLKVHQNIIVLFVNIPCCVLVPLDFLEYASFCVTSVVAPLVPRENGLYVCISVHVLLDTRFSEFTSCVHSCVLFNSGSD